MHGTFWQWDALFSSMLAKLKQVTAPALTLATFLALLAGMRGVVQICEPITCAGHCTCTFTFRTTSFSYNIHNMYMYPGVLQLILKCFSQQLFPHSPGTNPPHSLHTTRRALPTLTVFPSDSWIWN